MKRKLTVVLLILAMQGVAAQDTIRLALPDAVHAALANNSELKLAKFDQESSASRYAQGNAVFLPQLKMSYTASETNNPLNVFAFKLQQKSVTPGDFNPQLLNEPSAVSNYLAQIDLAQPVLNLDLMSRRKAAGRQMEVYGCRTQQAKQVVRFEVEKAYSQLQLAHETVRITRESLQAIGRIYGIAGDYFDKGYLQTSDLLLIQVQIATVEAQLSEASSNVQNASDYISFLMGVKDNVIYTTESPLTIVPAEKFERTVPETRADLMAMNSALKAQEAMVQGERRSYLPKLNVFASYMLNDKTAFGFSSGSYLAGAQLSLTVFDGTSRRNRVNEQRIAYSATAERLHLEKEKSQVELNKALRQLDDLQFAIVRYQSAADHASEALRILQDRFDSGLASTRDVLLAETTLSQQRLLLNKTVVDYNIAAAHVRLLTSTPEININEK